MSARPVWPVQQPEAPWDDPPAELGYGQMSRHLGARTPPRAVYDARVAALLAALREGAECAALGHELGVDGTVHPRGGDYEVEVDRPATVPELIRVATDHYPAAGSDAADVLLGPYADALDVRRPDDLFALKVALAAMALVPSDLVGQTAYERWANTKPRPSLEDRAMVRAVLWAPWTLWELVDGERVDRLGLSAGTARVGAAVRRRRPLAREGGWHAQRRQGRARLPRAGAALRGARGVDRPRGAVARPPRRSPRAPPRLLRPRGPRAGAAHPRVDVGDGGLDLEPSNKRSAGQPTAISAARATRPLAATGGCVRAQATASESIHSLLSS